MISLFYGLLGSADDLLNIIDPESFYEFKITLWIYAPNFEVK